LPPEADGGPGQSHKVHLKGAQETLLIPLYARALDSRSSHPILGDKKADEIVRSIDYDFERLKGFGDKNVFVIRAKRLDEWTRGFLLRNPDAVVLNLGCGLDSRMERVRPPPSASWFDLDYPEVIEERKKFFSDREGYQMLEASLTDPAWLEGVPRDRPAMVVADGVLEYLAEEEVGALFNRLTAHLSRGEMAFDVMNSAAIKSGRSELKAKTGAEHKWAVDDIRVIERLDPKLRVVSVLSPFESKELPLGYRIGFRAASALPSLRNAIRLLRCEFGATSSSELQRSPGRR
jgi:O-methyltransferase involved in polyketide biosynthesis